MATCLYEPGVRIHHVFREMSQLGGTLRNAAGEIIKLEDALELPFVDAKEALVQTKIALGSDGILRLYKGKHAEIDVDGVTVGDFTAYNHSLNKKGENTAPFYIHPEHFFSAAKNDSQYVMETAGMYKEPIYQFLKMGDNPQKTIPEDPDTTITLATDTGWLVSDKMDLKIMGMHQLKMKKGGMKLKLGIFFPEAAPKEMIEGHKRHLAVEFTNVITYAGQNRGLKGKLLNFVLKHKKM